MKWFLIICAILALVAGMGFGYLGNENLLNTGLYSFIALLVAANLDRISEFKASSNGIEARTREVVARAETAVFELQLLAKQLAELSLSLVKRQGRWGGYSDQEQEAIRASVLHVLQRLGLEQAAIESVLTEWHRVVEFDFAHHILGGSRIPEDAPSTVLAEWKALRAGGIGNFPSPQEIRAFLTKHGYWTDEIENYLKDYEYYRANRIHRRPEVWKERQHWGHLKKIEPNVAG